MVPGFWLLLLGLAAAQGYDCQAGLPAWRSRWSRAKQAWCCEHEGLACFELSLPEGEEPVGCVYDCRQQLVALQEECPADGDEIRPGPGAFPVEGLISLQSMSKWFPPTASVTHTSTTTLLTTTTPTSTTRTTSTTTRTTSSTTRTRTTSSTSLTRTTINTSRTATTTLTTSTVPATSTNTWTSTLPTSSSATHASTTATDTLTTATYTQTETSKMRMSSTAAATASPLDVTTVAEERQQLSHQPSTTMHQAAFKEGDLQIPPVSSTTKRPVLRLSTDTPSTTSTTAARTSMATTTSSTTASSTSSTTATTTATTPLSTTTSTSSSAPAAGALVRVLAASPIGHFASLDEGRPGLPRFCVAVSALILGGLTAWRGPAMWPWIFLGTVSVLTASVAASEAALDGLAPDAASRLLLAAPSTLLVALSVLLSFEAWQRVLGFALGLLSAQHLADWVEGLAPVAAASCYVAASLAGLLCLSSACRRCLLATAAPLFGGLLAVSGLGVLLAPLQLPFLPPAQAPWLQAASSLFGRLGLLPACSGAALAALLHALGAVRPVAAACLALGILAGAPLTSSALLCLAPHECPEKPDRRVGWSLAGSLLWAVLAGVIAWYQLGVMPGDRSGFLDKDDLAYDTISQSEDPSFTLTHEVHASMSQSMEMRRVSREYSSARQYSRETNPGAHQQSRESSGWTGPPSGWTGPHQQSRESSAWNGIGGWRHLERL